MTDNNTYIFDFEVFKHDWVVTFREATDDPLYTVIHNNPDNLKEFMEREPLLCGWNSKYYDNHILRVLLNGATPEEAKELNDYIIAEGKNGWQHPLVQKAKSIYFKSFDVKDDSQAGVSLKSFEAHYGMDITETEVDFNLDRQLTDEELEKTIQYNLADTDATYIVYKLRQDYLDNKIFLGSQIGLNEETALSLTNAKLTAKYLNAEKVFFDDARDYKYPSNLLMEYIPKQVKDFYDRLYDYSIDDEELFHSKLDINIGECPVVISFGGIHGAIPTYEEIANANRSIENEDVASYYPHLMTIDGYLSRAIAIPTMYEEMLERRMAAKKSGDKKLANALKLVANTTYGATLDKYNDLFDPLMARSVCITGQLRLLELAEHLYKCCETLRIIQLNTDGIIVSFDETDRATYQSIVDEWQERTGFELECDKITHIIQKDVNNYIEIKEDGSYKAKGGMLVRGLSKAGAFNINNNAPIIPKAVIEYFVNGTPIEETIDKCNDPKEYQLIAKASSKYKGAYHMINGEPVDVQKCNRCFATDMFGYGTLYKISNSGQVLKQSGLPMSVFINNSTKLSMDHIDKWWYIHQAKKTVSAFRGLSFEVDKRAIRKLMSDCDELLQDNTQTTLF